MDTIEDYQQKDDIEQIIKTAANQAKEKLQKYYKYTDAIVYTVSTSMYFFASYIYGNLFSLTVVLFLVLDPRLKLTYHNDHNWEKEYIDKAQNDITSLYEEIYASVGTPIDQETNNTDVDDDLLSHIYKKPRVSESGSELNFYLGSPVVPGEIDLLQWWKV